MKIKVFQNSQIENILVSKLIKPGFRLEKTGKHKKGKKCCGLSLLLFIMLGLSLNVFSDVNALKHDVQYIPISSQSALTGGSSSLFGTQNPPFSITWTGDNQPDRSSFKMNQNHYFTSRISNSLCTFVNYDDHYYVTPSVSGSYSTEFSFSFPSYVFNYNDNQYNNNRLLTPCMQNSPFGQTLSISNLSHPNFDDSSLVNIPPADRPPYLDLSPYYYDFDSFYVHDTAIDTNSGIHYNNSLNFSEIIGFPANKFSSLIIPLGKLNEDVVGVVDEGRNVRFDGVFDFSGQGNYFNWNPSLDNSSYFRLYYSGLTESQSVIGISTDTGGFTDCTSNFVSLDSISFYQLEFSCEFQSPVDFYNGQLWFALSINSGSASYLFDTNADWSFSSAYFVTDNDDTPGGTWGYSPSGNHLDNAPGSAQSLVPGDESWFDSLKNLFTFDFINPFAPIFGLFTDQNQCAQIPTLSSMLNSEETEVCPWFDSSTRSIVTPVLGLSSMMLLFGFVVRWLGARSGNFFEDSGGIDSGGYHFENKFRRKK